MMLSTDRVGLFQDGQQRILLAALQAAASGIMITDRDGVIQYVNPAFTAMTGYAAEDAIGQTPRILKSGENAPELYTLLWNTVMAGRVWHGELFNRHKDGHVYAEEQTVTPVRDAGGDITHFVAVKTDVTERKRITEALWHSEAHYRSLIENALDIILVLDGDGAIRYASPSLQRILGYAPAEQIGRSVFEFVHPADLEAAQTIFHETVTDDESTRRTELRVRHRDGSWRSMEAVGRALFHDPGVAGVVINARDVTARKEAEEVQQRLQQQLSQREKLSAMGELLAGVAHELNNPLSVVIGHTTLLRSGAADRRVAARADKIRDAAERCGRIVKNFLALARQHPPQRAGVDLNALVRDVVELVAYQLHVDNVVTDLDLADDLPAISGDPHQLQQVLVNLVTNAHHAMRAVDGPRCLSIASRFDRDTLRVCVEVSDTGAGIAPDVEARIFEPFFTTKPLGQGTGLGLAICKGIIESHGGSLQVEGRPGRGARFRFEVPSGSAAPPDAEPAPSSPPLDGQAILVVDDEPEVGAVLAEMLVARGHDVTLAANGLEALQRIAARSYDVILTDVKMPELDGPGLCREIARRHPELAGRLALITGDVLNPTTARFLEESRTPFLKKPFTTDEIEVVLRRVSGAEAGACR